MVTPTLPLAAYIRVSEKGDREELKSPEFQIEAIKRASKQRGIEVDFSFPHDIDVSGAKAQRKTLDSIITRIEAGELGGIYVSKLDRLSRMTLKNRVDLFDRIESKAGGVVLSASEGDIDPSTPEGWKMREDWLSWARYQWLKFAEGWDISQASAIKKGFPIVKAPIGYRKVGPQQPLEIDPILGPIVRRLFQMRAKGIGRETLAQFMHDQGVLTGNGNTNWSTRGIQHIIQNRTYLGELRFGKHVNPEAHKALVDLVIWEAAQNPNGVLSAVRSKQTFLLSGLLRCSECRYCMSGTSKNGKRWYRCNQQGCSRRYKLYDAGKVERALTFPDIPVLCSWTFWADGTGPVKLDTTALQLDYDKAKALLDQAMTPEIQVVAGVNWANMIQERRTAADSALRKLAEAQNQNDHEEVVDPKWTTAEFRTALGRVIDCIAAYPDRTIVVYPKGLGPKDNPHRGMKEKSRKSFGKAPTGVTIRTF